MKHMKKGSRGLAVAAVFAVGALLAGCTGGGDGAAPNNADAGSPVSGGTMSYAINVEPTAWDIHSSAADIVAAMQRNVFDSLVFQNPDGTFSPWLAKSWTISPDGLSYTFDLRQDVTFSDGTEFNAESVKANFDHIVNPDTKSQYAVNLIGPYTGTDVVDDHTAKVNFSTAFSPFLQAASTPYLGFYSAAALAKPDQLNVVTSAIGTGPFTVGKYSKGQEIDYVKNPDYDWAPESAKHQGAAYLDKLVYRFIPEDSARVGALTSEQVDVAGALPPSSAETLKANNQLRISQADSPGLPYTLFLNTSRPPLNDVKVRQAIQHALPLDQIVSTIYFKQYKRAWGPLTPASIAYDSEVEGVAKYDVDLTNKLLDQAGWTERNSDGFRAKNGTELKLQWPVAQQQREQRDVVAQSVVSALKKVGINLVVQPLDTGTYINKLLGVDYDVMDWSFVRSDGDILRLHLDSQYIPIQNASAVNDPKLDELVESALNTTDLKERNAIYAKVQMYVVDNALMIPVYVPGFIWGATAKVQGIVFDSNAWPLFYDAWVKP